MNTRVLLLGAIALGLYLVFSRGPGATSPFFSGLPGRTGTAGINTNTAPASVLGAPNALAGGIATLESGLTAIFHGTALNGPGQSVYAAGSLAQGESLETDATPVYETGGGSIVGPTQPTAVGAPALPSAVSPDSTNYLSGIVDTGTSLEIVPPPQLPTASLAFDSSTGGIDTYFDPSQYGDLTGLAAPAPSVGVSDGGVL